MRGSRADIPAVLEADFGTIRAVDWGGMNAALGTFQQEVDPAPFFKGLPDDRCQCPHWGYVVRGQMRYRFADHEEVYNAGDVYYVLPGHTPVIGEDTEYVEFSPLDRYHQTMEAVGRNMAAMQQQA